MVVRKPPYKTWWLDFQGFSIVKHFKIPLIVVETESNKGRILKPPTKCLVIDLSLQKKLRKYLEDHPRTCKWLRSPPFISHKKAIWKGNNPTSGTYGHHVDQPLTNWDDLPSTIHPTLNIAKQPALPCVSCTMVFFGHDFKSQP